MNHLVFIALVLCMVTDTAVAQTACGKCFDGVSSISVSNDAFQLLAATSESAVWTFECMIPCIAAPHDSV